MAGASRDITQFRDKYVRRKADDELEELLRTAERGDADHRAAVHGALGVLALPVAMDILETAGKLPESHKGTRERAYLAHTLRGRGYSSRKAGSMAESVHAAMRGRHSGEALGIAQSLGGARGGELTRDQAKAAIRNARRAFLGAGKRDPSILSTIGRVGLRRAKLFGPHALIYGTAGALAGKKLHEQRVKTLRAIHEDD